MNPISRWIATFGIVAASWAGGLTTGSTKPANAHHLRPNILYKATGSPAGACIPVRINGSKPLCLLLDSGASGLVVGSNALKNSGAALVETGAEAGISGFGAGRRTARQAVAETVDLESLVLRNVPLRIVSGELLGGNAGILGLDVFQDYVIEWDLRRGIIALTPAPSDSPAGLRMERRGHLLFVETVFNQRVTGYGLLDTGASHSLIESDSANRVSGPTGVDFVPMRGVLGQANATRLGAVRFDLGDARLIDRETLGTDLSAMGERFGIPLTGVIGYPALLNSTLTLNYRASTVRISRSK